VHEEFLEFNNAHSQSIGKQNMEQLLFQ